MAKLVVGCGYLGSRVAQRWSAAGEDVYAITRSTQRAQEFEKSGLRPIVWDITQNVSTVQLPSVETVLYAVGYDSSSQPIEEVYATGLRHVLDRLEDGVNRVIYISSTGVYGDAGGEWIDEETAADPTRDGGRASLAAEQTLLQSRFAGRGLILRLAGIYGPNRIPRASLLQAGDPIPAPAGGYLNLIHVDDAASIVLAAENYRRLPATFVVADGAPVVRRHYYEELARLLGAPVPRFADPDPESPAARRASSNKRINPAKLMRELRPQLAYPSFREGLAAIVGAQ